MDFAQSGLPQDQKIEKAFDWAKAHLKERYKRFGAETTESLIAQPVRKALPLLEGFDETPIDFICASLLASIHDIDEDRVKAEFGQTVCDLLDKIHSVPSVCGKPEVIADVYKDPSVSDEGRVAYLATAISGVRGFIRYLDNNPDADEAKLNHFGFKSFTGIGYACEHSNSRMGQAFRDAVQAIEQKLMERKQGAVAAAPKGLAP